MLNARVESDREMPESQGKHTILFLPGLLNDGRLFSAQMEALRAKGHICQPITLDFADTIMGLAQGVLEQAPETFSLVALSMGGYAALEVMRQLQAKGELGRVQKLALLNTSAREDSDEQRQHRAALIKLSQMGKFKGVTPRLMPQLLAPQGLANPAITDLITAMAADIGQAGFVRQQMAILSRPDSRHFLSQLQMPALVIGGQHDKLTPPIIVGEIALGIPHAELHVLPDCGHLSPLEQAPTVTELLTRFFG